MPYNFYMYNNNNFYFIQMKKIILNSNIILIHVLKILIEKINSEIISNIPSNYSLN